MKTSSVVLGGFLSVGLIGSYAYVWTQGYDQRGAETSHVTASSFVEVASEGGVTKKVRGLRSVDFRTTTLDQSVERLEVEDAIEKFRSGMIERRIFILRSEFISLFLPVIVEVRLARGCVRACGPERR